MNNRQLLAAALTMTVSSTLAVADALVTVTPLVSGSFSNGDGVSSHWVQVDTEWRGVIYGSESWGTGIWGLADAELVLGLDASSTGVVTTYSGILEQIAWADKTYRDLYGGTWGVQPLVPFFADDGSQYQDNYAVRFTGYIAITDPGRYNFGVLYDDGFRFNLYGNGSTLTILKDGLNPRDRLGFAQDLQLAPGLYGFDLTAYERLEAGVVNLSWLRPDATDWTTIPRANLYTVAVPEPAHAVLWLAGLALLPWLTRKRRTAM